MVNIKKSYKNLSKLKLQSSLSKGFTLVELLISILIFASFLGILMMLFSKSSDSFKITSWKQQKTAQAQIFWTTLKQHIEEATDLLTVQTGVDNPKVTTSARPILVNSNASPTSNILAWGQTKLLFDYTSGSFNHTASTKFFLLKKHKKSLYLQEGSKILSKISDVDSVKIKITSVILDATTKEEHLKEGAMSSAIASIVAISIVLKPPANYMARSIKLVQNHKFRVNIKAKFVTNPNYP